MLNKDTYDLLMQTSSAIYGAMQAARAHLEDQAEPPPLLQVRGGFAESPGWFLIQAAEFDPEPLTVANVRVRDIYASERIVLALLEMMAGECWLERDEAGAYHLVDAGRAILQRSRERQWRLLAAVTPPGDIQELALLLDRLIQASLGSPTPPGIWCLAHSRNRAPTMDAGELARLQQYFADFNAFRDDAHMAAWQPLGISGFVWEAFSLICDGAASSAATVFAALAHRGYARSEYAQALADLAQRGWIEPAGGPDVFRPTARGESVREQVEQKTDHYFYAPWSCLTAAESDNSHALLRSVSDRLGALG